MGVVGVGGGSASDDGVAAVVAAVADAPFLVGRYTSNSVSKCILYLKKCQLAFRAFSFPSFLDFGADLVDCWGVGGAGAPG